MVSGGANTENGQSLSSTELGNIKSKRFEVVQDMQEPRFGHALVKIGKNIIAVGGK